MKINHSLLTKSILYKTATKSSFIRGYESAKLHVVRTFIPCLPRALRARSTLRAPALRAQVPCALSVVVPPVSRALCALVPHVWRALRAFVPHVPRRYVL